MRLCKYHTRDESVSSTGEHTHIYEYDRMVFASVIKAITDDELNNLVLKSLILRIQKFNNKMELQRCKKLSIKLISIIKGETDLVVKFRYTHE